jgi:hypothetical protein
VRTLQNNLRSNASGYQRKLNNAISKHGANTNDLINQITVKRESLDNLSEAMSKSFVAGNIDMSTFVQVSGRGLKGACYCDCFSTFFSLRFCCTLIRKIDISRRVFSFFFFYFILSFSFLHQRSTKRRGLISIKYLRNLLHSMLFSVLGWDGMGGEGSRYTRGRMLL